VRGLLQKPQHDNQTGFHPSHSSFVKAAFPKVTAHSSFSQSHSPTKHTLSLPSVKQKKEVNLIDKMLIFLSCCVDKPNSK
jgi:hypothetical protein